MVHGSRWQGWTTALIVSTTVHFVSSCAEFDSVLKRLAGGSDGTARTTAAVPALGHPGDGPLGAHPAAPAAPGTVIRYMALRVDGKDSDLGFSMSAPLEQIRGRVSSVSGRLMVNPEALSQMTGVLTADLSTLDLYQRVRPTEQSALAEESRNTQQNDHARNWLEISADVPEAQLDVNRKAEFRPTRVEVTGAQTLSALAKAGTSATLEVQGELTIHGVTKPISTQLLLTADIANGQLNGLHFNSIDPIAVDLATFGIEPRDGFGKLAQKTLAAFAPKVAKEALVSIACTARPHSQ